MVIFSDHWSAYRFQKASTNPSVGSYIRKGARRTLYRTALPIGCRVKRKRKGKKYRKIIHSGPMGISLMQTQAIPFPRASWSRYSVTKLSSDTNNTYFHVWSSSNKTEDRKGNEKNFRCLTKGSINLRDNRTPRVPKSRAWFSKNHAVGWNCAIARHIYAWREMRFPKEWLVGTERNWEMAQLASYANYRRN